jgi:hypothetical protein
MALALFVKVMLYFYEHCFMVTILTFNLNNHTERVNIKNANYHFIVTFFFN